MIQVRHPPRDIVDELRHPSEVIIVEVFWLVGDLVVVPVSARGEEHDGNAVARIHVMVAATVDVLRMAVGVETVVEREAGFLLRVHIFDEVTEFRRATSSSSGSG